MRWSARGVWCRRSRTCNRPHSRTSARFVNGRRGLYCAALPGGTSPRYRARSCRAATPRRSLSASAGTRNESDPCGRNPPRHRAARAPGLGAKPHASNLSIRGDGQCAKLEWASSTATARWIRVIRSCALALELAILKSKLARGWTFRKPDSATEPRRLDQSHAPEFRRRGAGGVLQPLDRSLPLRRRELDCHRLPLCAFQRTKLSHCQSHCHVPIL